MTRPHPPLSRTVIDEASAWVVRLGADDVSEADYQALEAWLARSPEHALAFTEAEGLWAALDDDRAALDAALTRSAPRTLTPTSNRGGGVGTPGRRWTWAAGGVAAAAAAVLAAFLFFPGLGDRTTLYVTAPGEPRTVSLGDGSTIVMNGASRLSVRLSGRERLVEMGSAEAAFDVAHDANRPFRVTVGESRIEVLGTAFDVRRDQQSTRVSVSRGVVRVSDLHNAARNVRLTAGMGVARDDATDMLELTEGAPAIADWRAGRLVYNDRPLSEVATDLSRAYPIPVRTVGDASDIRFTGVLTLDDQASTLRRLESFLPVSAARRGEVIELRPR